MTDFDALVARYLELFPEEEGSLRRLSDYLASEKDPIKRADRKNYRGHVTASCLLVEPLKQRVLLFFHPVYRLLLQPGGHLAQSDESPLEAATRKLFDETPYNSDTVKYLPYDYDPLVPLDIESHNIPANDARGEREHIHHDLRYVFLSRAADDSSLGVSPQWGNQNPVAQYSYHWYRLSELSRWSTFSRLSAKLGQFLSRDAARRRFYVSLTSAFELKTRVNTIIVTHVLPDSFEFIDALHRCTNLVGVIPKPRSVHAMTRQRLVAAGIPVFDWQRSEAVQRVAELVRDNAPRKTVLLDIGGWFGPIAQSAPQTMSEAILGVVEDTRNGQDKYEVIAESAILPFPIVSLAESALKANEDFLVGQSIVFSADVILRECGLVLEYLKCGVVGYGKIGRSIAHHLHQRGVKSYVVERNPLRRLEAFRELCDIRHRDWVSENVDVTCPPRTGPIFVRVLG